MQNEKLKNAPDKPEETTELIIALHNEENKIFAKARLQVKNKKDLANPFEMPPALNYDGEFYLNIAGTVSYKREAVRFLQPSDFIGGDPAQRAAPPEDLTKFENAKAVAELMKARAAEGVFPQSFSQVEKENPKG